MPRELAACVERANLDPAVHVIALAGNGKGFCGGYDLVASAERIGAGVVAPTRRRARRSIRRSVARNHDPRATWDPMVDYQMMSRNVRGFMSLFHSDKPVVCKVHGFCVAGGTDMALCCDLLVIEDTRQDRLSAGARVGRADDRAVGRSHRPEKAKRLLFTGDCLSGTEARRVGPRDRVRRRAPSSTRASRRCSSASRACRSTSS